MRPETCERGRLNQMRDSSYSVKRIDGLIMDKTRERVVPSTANGTFRVKRTNGAVELVMQRTAAAWTSFTPLQ